MTRWVTSKYSVEIIYDNIALVIIRIMHRISCLLFVVVMLKEMSTTSRSKFGTAEHLIVNDTDCLWCWRHFLKTANFRVIHGKASQFSKNKTLRCVWREWVVRIPQIYKEDKGILKILIYEYDKFDVASVQHLLFVLKTD